MYLRSTMYYQFSHIFLIVSLPEDQRSSISTSSTKSQQQQTSNSTFYVKSNHFDQGHGMVDSRRSKLDQNAGIDKCE